MEYCAAIKEWSRSPSTDLERYLGLKWKKGWKSVSLFYLRIIIDNST